MDKLSPIINYLFLLIKETNLSGYLQHAHVVEIEALDLPLDVRKQLLLAVRKQQKAT